MTPRPAPTPSPQARRQAHLGALREALAQRDPLAVERLLGQWVHRHGHPALEALLLDLQQADPGAMAWWQGRDGQAATAPAAMAPAVTPQPGPAAPQASSVKANPPKANPELARLRSWLPDRVERRRAA